MSKHKFLLAALVAGNLALFGAASTLVAGGGGGGEGFCAGPGVPLETCRCTEEQDPDNRQCLTVKYHNPGGEFCGGTTPTPQFFCMGGEN